MNARPCHRPPFVYEHSNLQPLVGPAFLLPLLSLAVVSNSDRKPIPLPLRCACTSLGRRLIRWWVFCHHRSLQPPSSLTPTPTFDQPRAALPSLRVLFRTSTRWATPNKERSQLLRTRNLEPDQRRFENWLDQSRNSILLPFRSFLASLVSDTSSALRERGRLPLPNHISWPPCCDSIGRHNTLVSERLAW